MPLLDMAFDRAAGSGSIDDGSVSPTGRRTGYAAAAHHAMSSRRPKHVHAHQHSLAGHPLSPLASDPAMQVDPSLEALAAHTSTSVSTHALPPSGDAALTRKAQNRLAQREFRQRKQEYIRALECRVELLSSDPGTQIDRLRWLLRQLMLENAKLRVMLGVVAAHISADGAGGFLGAHANVRTELEQFVFNPSEQRSLKVWDPHSDDNDGHLVLNALRAQSQLPPEASLAPVKDGAHRSLPTLPDLRQPPPKRQRKRSGDKKVDKDKGKDKDQDKDIECSRTSASPFSSSPSPPTQAMPEPSAPSAAPVVAAAAAAAAASPASVVPGLPAWGVQPWSSIPGIAGYPWPPSGTPGTAIGAQSAQGTQSAQGAGSGAHAVNEPAPMEQATDTLGSSAVGQGPAGAQAGINNSFFAALYRASMSLDPPKPSASPMLAASPQQEDAPTVPGDENGSGPSTSPSQWAWHSPTQVDQSAPLA